MSTKVLPGARDNTTNTLVLAFSIKGEGTGPPLPSEEKD
jgi:hypothetical protein